MQKIFKMVWNCSGSSTRLSSDCRGQSKLSRPILTPAGDLSSWSEADFFTALHSGQKPDHQRLNPDEMPWNRYGIMTDLDGYIYNLCSLLPRRNNTCIEQYGFMNAKTTSHLKFKLSCANQGV